MLSQVRQPTDAQKYHIGLALLSQDCNGPPHSILTISGCHTVQKRPAESNSRSSQCECLQHICSAPDASVDEYLHGTMQEKGSVLANFEQSEERRLRGVLGSSAVVGQDNSLDAVLVGEDSILNALDAFDHHRELGDTS